MKIAIYTLTRDRLEYTKHCFASLSRNAGYPYDHFILDNGSTDGTQIWLQNQKFHHVTLLPSNIGISAGSNLMLNEIFKGNYDLIIKMDNDCEIVTTNILVPVVKIFKTLRKWNESMILSPHVIGINKQPSRAYFTKRSGWRIGITGIVGGLFHIVQSNIYRKYSYPDALPKAWGQDDHFCEWARVNNIMKGYIEDIIVNHYETTNGQCARFPEYFERKWKEEKLL